MNDGIGTFVKNRRTLLEMTQAELSERTGVGRAQIAQIEGGRVALPGADTRRRLASALGVSHLEMLVAAGEITPEELGDTSGIVDRHPDDPKTQLLDAVNELEPRRVPFALRMIRMVLRSEQEEW